ncbi:MAG: GDYXXLXY domain-containing protein [Deltaproteobacteria bacterium]|nr:GDYXXLXY domain-containing protein [Deltaproteobacteria bacterium]
MSRLKGILLAVVLVCQLGALLGEYLNSVYPRWSGKEVKLKIEPVDPRSLFRGQYARLNYDIGSIPARKLVVAGAGKIEELRLGEIVYVSLEKSGDLHHVKSIQLDKPDSGVFIRGRLEHEHTISQDTDIQVKYGIEAFFASPKKAIEVERQARSRDSIVTARVMIAPNGKASLLDVVSR